MHDAASPLAFASLVLASTLGAQRVLTTVYGTTDGGGLGTVVRNVGDLDGDGTDDLLMTEPTSSQAGTAYLVSGRTSARIVTFTGSTLAGMWGLGTRDASPIGDVNGDGRTDFAIGYANPGALDVFSGANGSLLYRKGPPFPYAQFACGIGDVDGDNLDDFAAFSYTGQSVLWMHRGTTGLTLTVVALDPPIGLLRNVGDLTGDGKPEIAICGSDFAVYDLHPPRLLRQVRVPIPDVVEAEVADWDEDGRMDVLLGGVGSPFLVVVAAATGSVLATFSLPANAQAAASGQFAVLPDVDGDGHKDLVVSGGSDPLALERVGIVSVLSGATGRRIGAWPGSPEFPASGTLAFLGDVDGDGTSDFVLGNRAVLDGRGGWQVISTRVVASTLGKPVNCHAGPFAPTLGLSRPVLGQPMTIAGRDAPSGTLCTLVISPLPTQRTNLGVAGCDTWLDPAQWILLASFAATPSWQIAVPLPREPLLAGFELALQGFYAGTTTAIGFDLTNGVWARLGH